MNFFDYFAITALIIFYVLFIGRALLLKSSGINPFALNLLKKGFKGLLELLFLIGLILWTIEIIAHALKSKFHVFSQIFYLDLFSVMFLKVLGVILVVAGLVIFAAALASFGNSWRVGIDKRYPGKLVTDGIFAITRNPIFLFLDIYFLGMALIYNNLFFLLFFTLVMLGIHYQILEEEKFLAVHYGEEYKNYVKRVKRYL